MLVSINGTRVLNGQIVKTLTGAWAATMRLDGPPPTSSCTIEVGGQVRFVGTAFRPGSFRERHAVKIVGGGGGLATALPPEQHRGVPLSIPLGKILEDAGETLSATSDASILGTSLQSWSRRAGSAGDAIAELLRDTGASWRTLDDGTIWVGVETWPEVTQQVQALGEAPEEDWQDVATDLPTLRPGTALKGRRISAVVHSFEPERVRTRLYFERAMVDRLRAAFFGLARHALRAVDYHPSYAATVIAQQGNGDLQVRVDDPRFGDPQLRVDDPQGHAGVKRWPGVPGITYELEKGARVLFGFLDGLPKVPIVTGWLSGQPIRVALDALRIELGATATRGAARLADAVGVGTITLASVPGPVPAGVVITYQPGGGGPPIVGTIAGAISVGPSPLIISLAGLITSASSKTFVE